MSAAFGHVCHAIELNGAAAYESPNGGGRRLTAPDRQLFPLATHYSCNVSPYYFLLPYPIQTLRGTVAVG